MPDQVPAVQGGMVVAGWETKPIAAEVATRINAIMECMGKAMTKGIDYGTIPGCGDKPTLLKPGAEKIATLFGLAADPEVQDLSSPDEFRYRVKVRLVSAGGREVGAGIGEASTSEDKYRWKAVVCKEEWEATPEDRKRVKWKKGQGKPYSIQQVRTSPQDVSNTALKMAKKRALVDAVLTATAASAIFAQDLEDLEEGVREAVADSDAPADPKAALRDKPPAPTPEQAAAAKAEAERQKASLAGTPTPASAPAPAQAPAPTAPPEESQEPGGWPNGADLDDDAIGEYFDDAIQSLAAVTGEEHEKIIRRLSAFKAGDKAVEATSRDHLMRWKGGAANVRKVYAKAVQEIEKAAKK